MSSVAVHNRNQSTIDEPALARSVVGCFVHAKLPEPKRKPGSKQKVSRQGRRSTNGRIVGVGPDINRLAGRLCEPDWRRVGSIRYIEKITGMKDRDAQRAVVRDFLRGLQQVGILFFEDGAWGLDVQFMVEQQSFSAEIARSSQPKRKRSRKGWAIPRESLAA